MFVTAASQSLPSLAQPQCNEYQAAVRQRDERCWQLFRNTCRSRNEQQAQQEEQLLQHNEEEEESYRLLEQRELIRRHQESEDASNHMSRQDLAFYEAHNPREPPPPIPLPPHPTFQSINLNDRTIYHEPAQRHSLKAMTIECSRCHALHFAAEKLSNSTRNDIKFGMCCLSGQIILLLHLWTFSISLMEQAHTVWSSRPISVNITPHSLLLLWVLKLITLLLLGQDLIHFELVVNSIISLVLSFLFRTMLLSLPRYISTILTNNWLTDRVTISI